MPSLQESGSHNDAQPSTNMLIIGLDGATWRIIHPLVKAGLLPNLQKLITSGSWGSLESIVSPHTGPAWVSFMTGRSPGQHGIFSFHDFDLHAYGGIGQIVTSARYAGTTLFDVLSKRGLRVAAVRVPMTYPAWDVNGVMVSGYPSPDSNERYATPVELSKSVPPLRSLPSADDPEALLKALLEEIKETTSIAKQLLESNANDPYDLFMVTYQQLDYAHHFFWRFHDPDMAQASGVAPEQQAKCRDYINRCYQEVDAGIGRLLTLAGPQTKTIILSDHGAGPAALKHVHTNIWLREMGLLITHNKPTSLLQQIYNRVQPYMPARFRLNVWRKIIVTNMLPAVLRERMYRLILNTGTVDWSQAKAYHVPMCPTVDGIVINVRGRQMHGIVEPGTEYENMRDAIIEHALSLVDPATGEHIVRHAWRREDVYQGPYVCNAPDILLRLHPNYDSGRALLGDVITDVPKWNLASYSGTHEMDGIVIIAGPGVKTGHEIKGAQLLDVTPTLYAMMDAEPRPNLEGRVLQDIFTNLPAASSTIPLGTQDQQHNVPEHKVRQEQGNGASLANRQPQYQHVASSLGPSTGNGHAENDFYIAADTASANGKIELSVEEEQIIVERLRALGYL